jgi:hypothetical protein
MSMLMRTVLEAEATSAREAMRAAMREQDLRPSLRAALQELVRQGLLRVRANRPAGPGEIRLREMSNFCCLPGRAGGTPIMV